MILTWDKARISASISLLMDVGPQQHLTLAVGFPMRSCRERRPESIPAHICPNGGAASAEDDPVCSVRDAAQSADAVQEGQNRYFTQYERIQGRDEKSFPGVVIIQQMRTAHAIPDRDTPPA